MANKNKVEVTVKGKRNSGVVVGGTMGGTSSSDSENEVRVKLGGENNSVQVVGGDALGSTLGELEKLLISGVDEKNDKEYISEIVQQLSEQASKPKESRNESKIKGLLNNLATYVGLAGFAVSQAEKIRELYEHVLKFFN